MLPSSATRQEACPKRKSPTSVAARSPCRTCVVCSPRRKSAPSKMSSCTKEAECNTSMLTASFTTRFRFASWAPNALATSSVRAGLSRFPPDPKSRTTALRTSGLSADSANTVSSNILFTLTSSRPIHRMQPSSAFFGPPSGHSFAGTALPARMGSAPSPDWIRSSNSRSPAWSRLKPKPERAPATFTPSSKSGMRFLASKLLLSTSNSPKLRPRTCFSSLNSFASLAAHDRSTRWARRLMPRTAAAAEPVPNPCRASRADRANQRAMSCDSASWLNCANSSAQPKSPP
mmetsp:Transcript_158028/g.484314  ORF Transcript_158028/g.484314 Transcript_158028/m.484314 type:complete len:289 (-) Transcript_158028:429-1295(-)